MVLGLSLHSESPDRIDRSSTACWDEACHGGTEREKQNCAREGQRIVAAYLEKKAGHEMASKEGRGDSECEADENLPERAAKNEGNDAGTCSAERHADSDLTGALDDEVGHDSVEANGSEDQSENAEQACEACEQPVLVEVSCDLCLVGTEANDSKVGINGGEGLAHERFDVGRRLSEVEKDEADEHRAFFAGIRVLLFESCELLRQRPEEERPDLAAGIGHFEIGKYTDDFKCPRVLRFADAEVFSDRILVGKEVIGERLIDDGDLLRGSGVLCREVAATQNGNTDGVEEVATCAIPNGEAFAVWARRGTTLRNDAGTPHVAAEGNVTNEAYVAHGWKCGQAVFDLAVESGKPVERIADASGVELEDKAIGGDDAEVLVLEITQ